jgi:hypothetical protein
MLTHITIMAIKMSLIDIKIRIKIIKKWKAKN